MTLTKAELVQSVSEKVRLEKIKKTRQQTLFPEMDYKKMPLSQASEIIESLLEIIKSQLERGESVVLSGFGTFQVRFKWARKGRHPATGEPIIIPSRNIVSFRAGKKLKEKINGNYGR